MTFNLLCNFVFGVCVVLLIGGVALMTIPETMPEGCESHDVRYMRYVILADGTSRTLKAQDTRWFCPDDEGTLREYVR